AVLLFAMVPLPTYAQEVKDKAFFPSPTEPYSGGFSERLELIAALKKLGHEPTVPPNDANRCFVKIKRDELELAHTLYLSDDRKPLWVECSLSRLDAPAKVPAPALKRLLQASDKTGAAHFVYRPSAKRVILTCPIANRDMTPARLRKELERLDGT